jgi:hypothetical protein
LEKTERRQPWKLKEHDKTVVARALAAYDLTGTLKAAQEASGVYSRKTVNGWIDRRDELGFPASMAAQTLQDMYDDTKRELMSTNLRLQKRALKQIEAGIDKLGASQAAVVYGILTDKMDIMLKGDGANAEASVTQRADKLTDEDRDRIIRIAAKIITKDEDTADRARAEGAIEVEYTVAEDSEP